MTNFNICILKNIIDIKTSFKNCNELHTIYVKQIIDEICVL